MDMLKKIKFEYECAHDIYVAQCQLMELETWYKLRREKKNNDYIWDENLTVKANRELTAQYNADIDARISESMATYAEIREKVYSGILAYIQSEADCSEAEARVIWNYCEMHHSDEAHNWISDVCELYEQLKEARLLRA